MNKQEFLSFKKDYENKLGYKLSQEKACELRDLIRNFDWADVNNALIELSEREYYNWRNSFKDIAKIAKESQDSQNKFKLREKRFQETNQRLENIANEPSMKERHLNDKIDAVEDLKYSKVAYKLLRPIVDKKAHTSIESPLIEMMKTRYTQESIERLANEVKSGEHNKNLKDYEKEWHPVIAKNDAPSINIKDKYFYIKLINQYLKKGSILCFEPKKSPSVLLYYPLPITVANMNLRDDSNSYKKLFINQVDKFGDEISYPVLVKCF